MANILTQSPSSIGIIDYGMGNLRSVQSALSHLGSPGVITSDPESLRGFDKLVLPGVGAFAAAVKNLRERNLWEALDEAVTRDGKYVLGICLGMQLLADCSYEGAKTPGLGWIGGEVKKFALKDSSIKIPHIGFNAISIKEGEGSLLRGLRDQVDVYFVHSYHLHCEDVQDIAAVATYGEQFVAAVEKGNIFGTQFHPEKSQGNGLAILKNFVEL